MEQKEHKKTKKTTVKTDTDMKKTGAAKSTKGAKLVDPTNTAAAVNTTKKRRRRKQLRWVYDKIKNGDSIGKKVYAVDQLQAMQWSKDISRELQGKRTIERCFRHTGIVFNAVDKRFKDAELSSYGVDIEVEDIIIRAGQLSL
ncbi:hypothetical protein PC112_g12496 [Phytophthora cactorum]|nr:hypothetical protein PC112_g12496 [Phytophthora cactorum]